jgi:hypothetical protein
LIDFYDGPLSGWVVCLSCEAVAAFAVVDWDQYQWERVVLCWRWAGSLAFPSLPPDVDAKPVGMPGKDLEAASKSGRVEERLFAAVCDPYFERVFRLVDVDGAAPADWVWPKSVWSHDP